MWWHHTLVSGTWNLNMFGVFLFFLLCFNSLSKLVCVSYLNALRNLIFPLLLCQLQWSRAFYISINASPNPWDMVVFYLVHSFGVCMLFMGIAIQYTHSKYQWVTWNHSVIWTIVTGKFWINTIYCTGTKFTKNFNLFCRSQKASDGCRAHVFIAVSCL